MTLRNRVLSTVRRTNREPAELAAPPLPPPPVPPTSTPSATRLRLHFLDGIRGLAAFYVLIFHSLTIAVPQDSQSLSTPMQTLRSAFGYGHFAVATFIVLSGFSLTLPMARASSLELRDGFANYIRRRARRVFPPYYAALALSIAAILASSIVPGADTSAREDALSAGSVVSHLFLVHNLNFDWAFRINGPMWSVATEFQIYFLFPLILLPLWRRVGPALTVAICWAGACAIQFGLPAEQNFSWAAPWFVGSFALGMWAAFIGFGESSAGPSDDQLAHASPSDTRQVPWGWLALALLALLVGILALGGGDLPLLTLDAIVSVMSLCWILACVSRFRTDSSASNDQPQRSNRPTLNGVLGSRPMVLLGSFSYSLYVLQHPFLRLTEALLGRMSWSFETILWTQLIVGTPAIMAASYLFAQFFELPFTTGSPLLDSLRRKLLPRRFAPQT